MIWKKILDRYPIKNNDTCYTTVINVDNNYFKTIIN